MSHWTLVILWVSCENWMKIKQYNPRNIRCCSKGNPPHDALTKIALAYAYTVTGLPGTKLPWSDGTKLVHWNKRTGVTKIVCEQEWMGHIKKMPWGTVNHRKFSNGIGSEMTKFWCECAWPGQLLQSFWTFTLE